MTTLPQLDPVLPEDAPRKLASTNTGSDWVFAQTSRAIGASVLVITGSIGAFLAWQSVPTFRRYGWSFLTEQQWQPEADVLGIAAVLAGTVQIAATAILIAFPLAVATALYISEYAPERLKSTFVSLVDLMAAVPSIVYGLVVVYLLMEHGGPDFALWLHQTFGWIPIFDVPSADPNAAIWDQTRYIKSAFFASIAVAAMVLPMACAVMRQVFSQTPQGEKEAALALGATKWGMVRTVVLPFGRGGIIGGTMLGLGRALGETVAVLLIVSPAFEIKSSITEIGTSNISALIAGRFGEASAAQLSALLTAGFVLFMITLVINSVAAVIVNRSRSGAGTDA